MLKDANWYPKDESIKSNWHRVGLLTGMSPVSSRTYYWGLCNAVNLRYYGINYPQFSTENVNFSLIKYWMKMEKWEAIEDYLTEAMLRLEQTDVEAIAICSTTMHRIFDHVKDAISVPIIHIGDCVAAKIAELGLEQVGFIGAKTTMSEDFLLDYFRKTGAEVFLPPEEYWNQIDQIIVEEASRDLILDSSCNFVAQSVINIKGGDKMNGVILGCDELSAYLTLKRRSSILLAHQHVRGCDQFHFLDVAEVHIKAIAKFCCSGELPKF